MTLDPEPFGQVVIEGMAVAATDGGRLPETVVDGVTGLLVPTGDAAAMADAIGRLLDNPGRMGVAGRGRASERFTVRKTALSVQAIDEQVLADRAESR